jgi:aquaporin Z
VFVGSAIMVAVSPLGARSGGHLNPAISIGFWLHGKLAGRDTATYVMAQVAGATAAAATAAAIAPGPVHAVRYAVTRPGTSIGSPGAAGIEAAETCLVLLVIFALVSSRRTMRITPLVVWLLISSYVWLLAPLTGASVNPARSFGPALVANQLGGYWPYAVGPVTGAAAAAALWRVARLRPAVTMKLCQPAIPLTDAQSADAQSADAQALARMGS